MMSSGIALLLISAAVGYWVIERANLHQKKNLKLIGQIVGAAIIVVSFLGVACKIYYLSSGQGGGYHHYKGYRHPPPATK